MPRSSSGVRPAPRVQFLAVLALALGLVACTEDGGGGNGDGGTTSGSSTGGGPVGTSGGDDGSSACVDNQEGNDTPEHAYALAFAVGGGGLTFEGQVCPQESDWFELEADCAGFFRAELFCADLTGGETGGPDAVCDDGKRLDLQLWRDTSAGLQSVALSQGSSAIEVAHARVSEGRWLLEVRHAAGSSVDYTLRTAYLPSGACVSMALICEADEGAINATETSCEVLPSEPSCPSGDVHTQPVALPEVFDGMSGSMQGWTIHVAPHEIASPRQPTASEFALLAARCIDACSAEWASVGEITANCDSGSFSILWLRDVPSIPSLARIPPGLEDGSEVFPALGGAGCSLQGDCCERFASNLCSFRPGRVQPGPEGKGDRMQYEFELGGSVTMTGAAGPVAVSGIARLSDADAHWPSPRPVFVDVSFSRQSDTNLDLDCSDGTQASPRIQAFGLALNQPAFGVRSSNLVGFPPGALVYRLEVTVDNELHVFDRSNAVNVVGDLTAQGVALAFAEMIRIPCGGGTADIHVDVDLADTSTIAGPPEITMNLPSATSCPNQVTLNATVTDRDDDLHSVKWYVDGHLMAPSVEHVEVVQSGTLFEVVACDARSGCVREQATVDCLPYCDGEAVPCSEYSANQTACNAQPGCTQVWFICDGERSCDQFGEQDCLAADGCDWFTP